MDAANESTEREWLEGLRPEDRDAPRPTIELAADVRAALDGGWYPVREDGTKVVVPREKEARAALDALVARVADLEADAELHRIELHHANAKRAAAEAQVAALTQERDDQRERFRRHVETMIEPKLRARAVAAEAALATTRQALAGTAERKLDDGPCWCPDWIADDWRDDDPLDERVHHECCGFARRALAATSEGE